MNVFITFLNVFFIFFVGHFYAYGRHDIQLNPSLVLSSVKLRALLRTPWNLTTMSSNLVQCELASSSLILAVVDALNLVSGPFKVLAM